MAGWQEAAALDSAECLAVKKHCYVHALLNDYFLSAWLNQALNLLLVVSVSPKKQNCCRLCLEMLRSIILTVQVADRLNAAGVPCHLVTGQEVRRVASAQHTSCTVEMADVDRVVEVAVVDEIQMIGDAGKEGGYQSGQGFMWCLHAGLVRAAFAPYLPV